MPRAISLSSRSAFLKPTAVNVILAEMRALQALGRDVVSLMRGEPDFSTPPHIVDRAARALRDGRTRYPDNRGETYLREAVAAKLARDNGLTYDPGSEILISTGATLGIYAALMALIDEGDEVLLPDPVYDAYTSPILLAGGRVGRVPTTVRNGRFVLTAGAIESVLGPSTRAMLLNTPWNPVGTVFSASELQAIVDVAVRRNLVLISDEIYEAITYDGTRHVSPAALSPEARERTILINSLSKTYAMTGWRVGYCAAPKAVIDAMFLVLQQSSRGPATFVQDAAAMALAGSQDCVEAMRLEYARRRDLVLRTLDNVPRARAMAPEGGFFAMVDVSNTGVSSDDVRRLLLRDHGVAVVHGAAYGPGGEGTLRLSFGAGGDALVGGLARLRAGLMTL